MKRLFLFSLLTLLPGASFAEELLAGVGKADITRPGHDAGDNPPYVKALVLSSGKTNAVVIAVDAVAIAEIGSIRDPYLADVRSALQGKFSIAPESVIINASHCHAVVAENITELTIEAVEEAWKNRVPVKAGTGTGHEDRIMVNRRIRLADGTEADERHAYSLPHDEEVESVGPIDTEIGILRLDRVDSGKPLALVYQFACHPIQGIPSGDNTADVTGFASQVIEEHLGDGTAMALFLQGCGGDINPIRYKSVTTPRDGEPLGTKLGLSTLAAAKKIKTTNDSELQVLSKTLAVPRADLTSLTAEMEEEISALTKSLRGTTLNFESFLPLFVKYHLSGDYPSEAAHQYLQDNLLEKGDWKKLDENNRAAMASYLNNIRTMEKLTRKQINLALLEKHQARNEEAGPTATAEVTALRVGDFRLVTFPAEVVVQVGLNIKEQRKSPHTFVSGYTNGYLYYAPTVEQMKNRGGAQEDSDCLLAPGWQEMFETTALELLSEL
ncbi:hypothetical protein N9406_08250 [Verrucomicrobiales bacterium]|nr:hypothetical protein [Verrucomicrobiales bacterium]MDB3940945.1 hypothetical protein [Verrucomicrobiales bacterium]